ncbi:uncharacterized protein LOC110845316 [Folsomia candida]|uniref:Uncharacterized protein n=1 Tax=Folsomia candida TaxID=158441 RepID=A0A226EQJ8_FOLCA|nr:uncharacterized protein LOC110845316 [Folsomia candida]OXA59905.1 hypothetical protein Fcan01_04115 [Folsomia candida]
MDIIYSTGLKPHLIKSYKDVDGKTRSGVRIWGWRLIQMIANICAFVAVTVAFWFVSSNHKGGVDRKSVIKVTIWFGIITFLTILTLSGLPLFLYAKYIRSKFTWEVTTGIYNMVFCHVIFYAMVLGCTDFFVLDVTDVNGPLGEDLCGVEVNRPRDNITTTTTTTPRPRPRITGMSIHTVPRPVFWTVFAAGAFCLIASLVHFFSALYPTPVPDKLRLQKVAPSNEAPTKVEPGKDSGIRGVDDMGGESGTTTVTEATMDESGMLSTTPSDQRGVPTT